MDTKLKKFSRSSSLQYVVFIITVLLLCGLSSVLVDNSEVILNRSYGSVNETLARKSSEISNQLLTLAAYYKSEEYLRSGATVTSEKIEQKKEELLTEKYSLLENTLERRQQSAASRERQEFEQRLRGSSVWRDQQQTTELPERQELSDESQVQQQSADAFEEQDYGTGPTRPLPPVTAVDDENDDLTVWEAFEEIYREEIENIPNQIIQEEIYHLRILTDTINSYEGVYYWIYGEDFQLSNVDFPTEEYFNGYDHNYSYTENRSVNIYKIRIAFDNAYAGNLEALAEVNNRAYEQVFQGLLIICLAALAGLLYLIITTGRKNEDEGIHLYPMDKIYVEFSIALLAAGFLAACYILILAVDNQIDHLFTPLIEAAPIAVVLALFLSLVRQLKNRSFLGNSLFYRVFTGIGGLFYKVFTGGPLMLQVAGTIVVLVVIAAIPFFGAVIAIPLGLWLGYSTVSRLNLINAGAERIKNGDYSTKIEVNRPKELKTLSDNINQIAEGLNLEVERRIKSERLKTDLISNVSHDIRTPLTSIITYIDLLKKENIDNEQANSHIEIIKQKADRLKVLTDDLFEASKASSGSIPVSLERVDIVALVRQGLGELDDKVRESALEFRVNMPQSPVYVWADGRLLWRVLENLLSNVFKYSLEKSRVYLDLKEDESRVAVEIKNLSAYELNIDEEELMERFKRGDESRHSEGSGLGLSIARSLMNSQMGSLTIKIDGDLFKATVSIPKTSV